MLYTTLHNRILRLVLAVLGELIAAAALNLFIVPLSLYTGGLLGFCQLVRTLLQDFLGVSFGAYDIAGVLYFLLNIPLLLPMNALFGLYGMIWTQLVVEVLMLPVSLGMYAHTFRRIRSAQPDNAPSPTA